MSPAASRTQGKDKLEASAARSSREREVAAACAALSESVEAGDTAWFERVIIQLRSILLEKQSEDAATQVETGRTTFPVRADPLKQKPPMSSMPPKPSVATGAPRTPISRPSSQQAEAQPPWLEALRLLETGHFRRSLVSVQRLLEGFHRGFVRRGLISLITGFCKDFKGGGCLWKSEKFVAIPVSGLYCCTTRCPTNPDTNH